MEQKIRMGAVFGLTITLALCVATAGCGGGGDSGIGGTPGTTLTGSYGSGQAATPAQLVLTATGGTLSLPCGSGGTLSTPLVTDTKGQAAAAGTFTDETGPVKVSGNPSVPATYTATISGSQITLVLKTATLTSTFTLVRGQTADLTGTACPN